MEFEEVSDSITATGAIQKDGADLETRGGVVVGVDYAAAAATGGGNFILRENSATGMVIAVGGADAVYGADHPRCYTPFEGKLHITIAGNAPVACIVRYIGGTK